jgi:predicted helicase
MYNEQVNKWLNREDKCANVDDFVVYDDVRISWSSTLKNHLKRGTICKYNSEHVRKSLYRPFSSQFLYFNEILNDRRGQFPLIFPKYIIVNENIGICVSGIGNRQAFGLVASELIVSMDFAFEKAQFFSFYIYDEDGNNRKENITDWALEQFQTQYKDSKIIKWDIFHYTYALLHHPHYRDRYAANLKRELPRIPFAPKSISTTNNNPNIASNILKTKTSRSIGESKKCASAKTKPKSNITTFSRLQAFHQKP